MVCIFLDYTKKELDTRGSSFLSLRHESYCGLEVLMRRAVFKIAQRELNNKTEDMPKSTPSPRKLQKALMRRLHIKERYWYPTKRFVNWKASTLSLPSRSKNSTFIDRAEVENLKKRQARTEYIR